MAAIKNDFIEVHVHQEAKKGNQVSGDMYFLHSTDDYFICAIADGLGNGPVARQSAEVVPQTLAEHHHETVDDLLHLCNAQMIGKRGAAVAIVKIYYEEKKIEYSCVGNVRFYMLHDQKRMIYPLPVMGYLSGRKQMLKTQAFDYRSGGSFILHSDGVVLRSPKAVLMKSSNACELYDHILNSITHGDDASFIVGSLLQ